MSAEPVVPAENFVATLAANIENTKMDDSAFRQFVRNTLPIVIYPRLKTAEEAVASIMNQAKKNPGMLLP